MALHDQFQAEADVYQWQIDHAIVAAPLNGEVLKGDLTDKVGSPVKEGDELMVVAQRSTLRAELQVDDRDIQDVKEGQTGKLATTSLPTSRYPFTVDRVIPLGQPKEAKNVFTVYGHLDATDASWRPGMAGEGRINVGRRTWLWWWTHRLTDFIRLKMWM